MKDYSKNVSMICSVCGNSEFRYDSKYNYEEMPDDAKLVCADCGKEYTKAQLLECNQELINENIDDVVDDVVKGFEKDLKKALRKIGK